MPATVDFARRLLAQRRSRRSLPRMIVATLQTAGSLRNNAISTRCTELLKHPQSTVRDAARRVLLSRRNSAKSLFRRNRSRPHRHDGHSGRRNPSGRDAERPRARRVRPQALGPMQAGTPELKLAEMRRLNNDLACFSGDLRQRQSPLQTALRRLPQAFRRRRNRRPRSHDNQPGRPRVPAAKPRRPECRHPQPVPVDCHRHNATARS